MTQWEYTWFRKDVGDFSGPNLTEATEGVKDQLNTYGLKGWELTSAICLAAGDGSSIPVVYYLKRPIQP